MTELEITARHASEGVVVVLVKGDVDLVTAPELGFHLNLALSNGASAVVVDLSECEYVDSSGLAVLASASHRHNGGPEMSIVAAPGTPPERVLEISRLDQLFRTYARVEDALRGAAND